MNIWVNRMYGGDGLKYIPNEHGNCFSVPRRVTTKCERSHEGASAIRIVFKGDSCGQV